MKIILTFLHYLMMRVGAKSDLLACLEYVFEAKQDAPAATCVVLDGAAIIQMLKPTAAKNIDDNAMQIFIPFLAPKFRDAARLDDSLKTTTRSKRGKGVRRRFVAAAAIIGNWPCFLRVDKNKMELFAFLAQIALKWFDEKDKPLVITHGQCGPASRYKRS